MPLCSSLSQNSWKFYNPPSKECKLWNKPSPQACFEPDKTLHLEPLHTVEHSMNNNFLVTLPITTSLYHTPSPLFTPLLIKKLEFTSNYENKRAIFFNSPSVHLKLFQFSTSFTLLSFIVKLNYWIILSQCPLPSLQVQICLPVKTKVYSPTLYIGKRHWKAKKMSDNFFNWNYDKI